MVAGAPAERSILIRFEVNPSPSSWLVPSKSIKNHLTPAIRASADSILPVVTVSHIKQQLNDSHITQTHAQSTIASASRACCHVAINQPCRECAGALLGQGIAIVCAGRRRAGFQRT